MRCSIVLLLLFFAHGALGKNIYVRKASSGSANGTSWSNAYGFSSFGSVFSGASADDLIYLRADEGNYTYTSTINLNNGGAVGKRVRVQGVDVNLTPAYATIVGSRRMWYLPSNPETITNASNFGGNKFFEVRAKSFQMSHLSFYHVGFVYAFNSNVTTDVVLENMRVYNVRSFIDQDATVALSNITIRNVNGTGWSKKFIRFQGGTHDVLIENCIANSGRQAYDDFAGGVVFDGKAYSAVVRNCYFLNGTDTQKNNASKYWNSDGYSSEGGNKNLRFENCRSSGWTDGGHDHKGENLTLVNCTSWDNKRNFRLWGSMTVFNNLTSIEPVNRGGIGGRSHIFLAEDSVVTVNGGIVKHNASSVSAFYLEPYAKLTLIGVQEVYGPNASANEHKETGATIVRL